MVVLAEKSNLPSSTSMPMYPDTSIERGNVEVSSWEKIDSGYKPAEYTNCSVPDSDPDILRTSALIMLNEFDRYSGTDRRSHLGNYKVVNGVPRNPIERTGLIGRGNLPRWGPNHFVDPIITCWKRDAADNVMTKAGRPIMQVLVELPPREQSAKLRLPGGAVGAGELLPEKLKSVFGGCGKVNPDSRRPFSSYVGATESVLNEDATKLEFGHTHVATEPAASSGLEGSSEQPTIETLLRSGWDVFKGYLPAAVNTDNAWKETVATSYHDPGTLLAAHVKASTAQFQWVVVDEDIHMSARDRAMMSKVAARRGAYFTDHVSPIIKELLALVERKGLRQQGLYRLSGNQANVKALKADLEAGKRVALEQIADVHELTGALKLMLRDMDPPLLTFELYAECIKIGTAMTSAAVDEVMLRLPTANLKILLSIVSHLRRVAAEEAHNKMPLHNLSLVFGPTIIRSPEGLSGDLKDHKLQCEAAKAIIEQCPTDLEALMRRRRDVSKSEVHHDTVQSEGPIDNSAARGSSEGATKVDLAASGGAQLRAQSGRGNKRFFTLTEDDCTLWDEEGEYQRGSGNAQL